MKMAEGRRAYGPDCARGCAGPVASYHPAWQSPRAGVLRSRGSSVLTAPDRAGSAARRHGDLGLLPDAQSCPSDRAPADEDGLQKTFAEAHRRYTGAINARFRWTGHLFQGRFGAVVMDEPHLLAAARYIALNPVVAGLVSQPGTGHGRAPARISRARRTNWQRWHRCARWSRFCCPSRCTGR